MLMLLKKDCRVNAVAILGSAILQTIIYVHIGILGLVVMQYGKLRREDVRDAFVNASYIGLMIMALMAAIYGAGAFALERRERSADFLGTLPVQRWRIIVSKLLVAATCLLIIWLINVATLVMPGGTTTFGSADTRDFSMTVVKTTSALALMAFGLGWMFSTFLNSASVAASISIATTLALVVVVNVTLSTPRLNEVSGSSVISHTAIWTGLVSLAIGTIYYLWRVEP